MKIIEIVISILLVSAIFIYVFINNSNSIPNMENSSNNLKHSIDASSINENQNLMITKFKLAIDEDTLKTDSKDLAMDTITLEMDTIAK